MRKLILMMIATVLLASAACRTAPTEESPVPTAQTVANAPAVETAEETLAPDETDALPASTEAPAAESRFAPLYAQMQQSVALPDMMAVPADMVADFYGVDPADCTDGLYYISFDNLLADEIVLVDAVDEAAAKRVEAALRARLAAKAVEADGYAPEQYAIIKKCSVARKGLTVAMLVSPEAKTLTAIFEQFCQD